jgi:hypothetical protein
MAITHAARSARLQRRLEQLGGTIEKGTILGEYVGEVCTKSSVVARTHVFLTGAHVSSLDPSFRREICPTGPTPFGRGSRNVPVVRKADTAPCSPLPQFIRVRRRWSRQQRLQHLSEMEHVTRGVHAVVLHGSPRLGSSASSGSHRRK